jgi:hypothetical protein
MYGGKVAGGVAASGRQGWRCAATAGFGPGRQLHAVGDGAPGMVNQVELQFGTQGRYWVDFVPLWEYLSDASKGCAPDTPQAWLDGQQDRLKANPAAAVLDTWAPFVQADNAAAPVTAGARYLRHRLDQLDSQGALQRGLPIGSGEIESAHRYLIQERLKLPGAWWSPAHLETMLALRLNRANREWQVY